MSENAAEFDISLEWESGEYGTPEQRATCAQMKIMAGDSLATRNIDIWAKTVRDSVRLCAYPMAMWLANNWWRLRWEPEPEGQHKSLDWRMSHEFASIGMGYVWPRVTVVSDGQNIELNCRTSSPSCAESITYLFPWNVQLSAQAFERGVDRFVGAVLARLDAMECKDTALHELWGDVRHEREVKSATLIRKIEACLGCDPDEAPAGLVEKVREVAAQAGRAAALELASACSGKHGTERLQAVLQIAREGGVSGGFQIPREALAAVAKVQRLGAAPWRQGWAVAQAVRGACGLNGKPVRSDVLFELLSLRGVASAKQAPAYLPVGIAVQNPDDRNVRFVFRRQNPDGIRFEAARFLGDYIASDSARSWLPVTDCKTSRQKFQRAFAAEFLCPIESLRGALDGNYSQMALDNAAKRFGVSPLAVASHLVNTNTISPADLPVPLARY